MAIFNSYVKLPEGNRLFNSKHAIFYSKLLVYWRVYPHYTNDTPHHAPSDPQNMLAWKYLKKALR